MEGKNVLHAAIRLPDCSVNREKYEPLPETALRGYEAEYTHVASMLAGDMPPSQTTEGYVTWLFFVAHDPVVGNYSHTEIRLKRADKDYDVDVRVRGAVKTLLKQLLAGKMTVIFP